MTAALAGCWGAKGLGVPFCPAAKCLEPGGADEGDSDGGDVVGVVGAVVVVVAAAAGAVEGGMGTARVDGMDGEREGRGEGGRRGAPGLLLGCALPTSASMAMRTEVFRPANEKLALLYLRMGILNLCRGQEVQQGTYF